jgi:hypothetical protein
MSYTIKAAEINPGMTITDEKVGIKRILTVATVEREEEWVTLWTAEGGITCIRPDTRVMVEGDRPVSLYPVHTVLRVPGVGSVVKVAETGSAQWISAETGDNIMRGAVDGFLGVSVVYSPESDSDVTEIPNVVQKGEDWERDNTEWRKHKWEDEDGDVWGWDENHSVWYVANADGIRQYTSGPGLGTASFPVTRVK